MELPFDAASAVGVLTAALLVTLVALVVTRIQLRRSRRTVRRLRSELDQPATRRAMQAANWAVRGMVGTAVRVRERGVGGMLRSSIEELTGWAVEDRQAISQVAGADGTVTILFSDIEDSTVLNERLGDRAWVALLDAHDELVHGLVDKEHGHVVKSQGDGFMIAFGEPDAAVRVAIRLQKAITGTRKRALRRTPIRVRVGIHAGHVVARDGDYFGLNVAMAARVAALASGGEILVTDGVREAVADIDFTQISSDAELKGIPGRHQLWAVVWDTRG
jgi:adenylate cyclase